MNNVDNLVFIFSFRIMEKLVFLLSGFENYLFLNSFKEKGKTNLRKLLKKRSIISKDIGELDLPGVSSCVLFKKLKHCLPYALKAFNSYDGFSSHDVQVIPSV